MTGREQHCDHECDGEVCRRYSDYTSFKSDWKGRSCDVMHCKHDTRSRSSTCTWTEDEDGNWHTECGQIYQFINGTPAAENHYVFCPQCGGRIGEIEERVQ
jgi:hypothetical protein